MPFHDGFFVSVDPTKLSVTIDLASINTKLGQYNYIEFRGDFSPEPLPDGSRVESASGGYLSGQLNGDIGLSHRPPVSPPPAPEPNWVIYQNLVDLSELSFLPRNNPAEDNLDLDGDYGFFIQPLPFSAYDDHFDFRRTDYPEYLFNPAPSPFTFPNLFGSSGYGNDVVHLWTNRSVYAGHLTAFDGGFGNDKIYGGDGNDTIGGGGGNDYVFGNQGADKVDGGDGNDRINGGSGKDELQGGGGRDRFVFNAPDSLRNEDFLKDFNSVDDVILLASDVFQGLDIGRLARSAFKVLASGADHVDANDRIIYDKEARTLSFDPDGNPRGPGMGQAAHVFATLFLDVEIHANDFRII